MVVGLDRGSGSTNEDTGQAVAPEADSGIVQLAFSRPFDVIKKVWCVEECGAASQSLCTSWSVRQSVVSRVLTSRSCDP